MKRVQVRFDAEKIVQGLSVSIRRADTVGKHSLHCVQENF